MELIWLGQRKQQAKCTYFQLRNQISSGESELIWELLLIFRWTEQALEEYQVHTASLDGVYMNKQNQMNIQRSYQSL